MTEKSFEELLEEEFPSSEITVVEGDYKALEPFNIEAMERHYKRLIIFIQNQLVEDVDFGRIAGTKRRTLYKAGAEKLHTFFRFQTKITKEDAEEQWHVPVSADTFPVFHYRYTTEVRDSNGRLVTTCDGSCNSYESKYRWRWVPKHDVPNYLKDRLDELEKKERLESEFGFAIDQAKTQGEYAKPQEYWDSWKESIKSGEARKIKRKARSGAEFDAWERGGLFYRVPNEDIYSQVNTLVKMAIKRSYVGAIIIAANASALFTQDIEDMDTDLKQEVPIKVIVPSRLEASRALIKYTESLGVENGGNFIKKLLDDNEMAFSLDAWDELIDLVDSELKVKETAET